MWEYTRLPLLRAHLARPNCRNALFLWIPKTAGTSLYRALGYPPKLKTLQRIKYRFANKGLVTFGHLDYGRLVREGYVSHAFDTTAYKFAITRNPYDRAVSLYEYLIQKAFLSDRTTFLEFCRKLDRGEMHDIGFENSRGLIHCNPQVRWMRGVVLDFVGRFESLEQDCAKILDALGLPSASVPHVNASDRKPLEAYFDDESRRIIERVYCEDFDELGYERKLPRSGGV